MYLCIVNQKNMTFMKKNIQIALCLSNVAFDSGSGMDGMRRIVRRYSVKVKYLCTIKD